MNSTKKILFLLAILAGLLIGLKFVLKPSLASPSSAIQPSNHPTIEPSTPPSVYPSPFSSSPKFARVMLDGRELSVELATTSEEKSQGLSGRSGIGSDGMLFVMNPPQVAVFWMKDMQFPIDILWIRDGKVAGVAENIPAPTQGPTDDKLPTYSSKTPVDEVLELPAGYAKQYEIKTGSSLTTL